MVPRAYQKKLAGYAPDIHDSGPQKNFANIWSMHFQDTHWVLWQIESALCYIWTYIRD